MSKSGRRKSRAGAAPARPAKQRRSGRAVKVTVAVLVLGALAYAGLRVWQSRRATPSVQDADAVAKGRELIASGRSLESLPYFRRGLEQNTQDRLGHLSYAVALLNAVHQGRRHFGTQQFAVRSSWERVAMVREALSELAIAQKQAEAIGDRRSIATAEGTRGQALGDWGLQWDALVAYRHSEWTDSTFSHYSGVADRLVMQMQHPVIPDTH